MSNIDSKIQTVFDRLLKDPKIQKAFEFIDTDYANKVSELKEMTLISGAPFTEKESRSPMMKGKLEKYGASECFIDSHDNAFGFLLGKKGKNAPCVVIEGHLDTVFPKGTPLKIVEKEGKILCPGVADDTAGLANILSALKAIKHANLEPVNNILIGGTSGEEGEGDIRGIKGLLDDNKNIAAVISIEPGDTGNIVYGAIGSRRYELVFKGPGGHSWSAYGLPSPIHALGRVVAKMAEVQTSANPKTTYTVGTIIGGTSVNSIALEARLKLDMRSVSLKELEKLEKTMLQLTDEGVAEENEFRKESDAKITVEKIKIGDRPAGEQAAGSIIVQATQCAISAIGVNPKLIEPSSTNANAPISRKIPAVVLRTGGKFSGLHSLDEWFNPEGSSEGVKTSLLLLFALTGLEGVTEPLL